MKLDKRAHGWVLALALAGCGGGGGSSAPVDGGPTISGSQSLPTENLVATEAASPAEGTAGITHIMMGGSSRTAAVFGGTAISPGDNLLAIPAELPFHPEVDTDAVAAAKTKARTPEIPLAGTVYYTLDGEHYSDSGLSIQNGGLVSGTSQTFQNVVFKYPSLGGIKIIGLRIFGPIRIAQGDSKLTVYNSLDFEFAMSYGFWYGDGLHNSYPSNYQYELPANGGTMYKKSLKMYFSGLPANIRVKGYMEVDDAIAIKQQMSVLSNQVIWFNNSRQDAKDPVPAKGVDFIGISIV